ncbi:MAG: hypothetical protein OEO79_03300 [Gemmatimonadota bacterium]|nr:hypothetical protein [Gemmatimonadota bacterium]
MRRSRSVCIARAIVFGAEPEPEPALTDEIQFLRLVRYQPGRACGREGGDLMLPPVSSGP